jgi:hypothetical protein
VSLSPHVDAQRPRRWPEIGGGVVGCHEKPMRLWQKPLACGGQFNQVVLPPEKGPADHLLQSLNPLGQPLLREVKPGRRTAEMLLFGRGDERSDLRKIEIHSTILADNQRLCIAYRSLFASGVAAWFR